MIKVMISEDEKIEREALRKLLNNHFGDALEVVAEARTGLEAIEYCQRFQPNVVLMDIQMPEMDGLDASRRIKEQFQDIEIIIITAYSTFDYAKTALKIGIIDFLIKPYSIKSLKEVIQNVEGKLLGKIEDNKKLGMLNNKVQNLLRILEHEFVIKVIREKYMHQKVLESFLEQLGIDKTYYFCAVLRFEKYVTLEIEMYLKQSLEKLCSRVLYVTIFDTVVAFAFNDDLQFISKDIKELSEVLGNHESSVRGLIDYQCSSTETDFYILYYIYRQVIEQLS